MVRLMRSQANGWAAGCSPEIENIPSAQGFETLEGSTLGGDLASRGGTGGVEDRGTAEEGAPVTWETPDLLEVNSGYRRPRDPSPTRCPQVGAWAADKE
jgi:hypothetical protein